MKTLIAIAAILAFTAAVNAEPRTPASGKSETAKSAEMKPAKKPSCADCPMHKKAGAKKCAGSKMCPEKIPGVSTVSRNVPGGVEVIMTAKDKETVSKIQELALVHYSNKETMDPACPGRVEGAVTKLENTADGAKVLITGTTPEAVKKIQAASAAEHTAMPKSAKTYMCQMKCVRSDKPGKCPKCGMPMEEVK